MLQRFVLLDGLSQRSDGPGPEALPFSVVSSVANGTLTESLPLATDALALLQLADIQILNYFVVNIIMNTQWKHGTSDHWQWNEKKRCESDTEHRHDECVSVSGIGMDHFCVCPSKNEKLIPRGGNEQLHGEYYIK